MKKAYELTFLFSCMGLISYVLSVVKFWGANVGRKMKAWLHLSLIPLILCPLWLILLIVASFSGV